MHKSETGSAPSRCLFAVEHRPHSGRNCFMHSHACTEIIWFRGCAGWMLEEDGRLRYEDGDFGIYQPGRQHGDACEIGGVQMCIGVNGGGAGKLPRGVWRADEATTCLFDQIRREISRQDDWHEQRLDLLSGCLVLELSRQLAATVRTGDAAPYHVTAARKIFDTRFAERLSMPQVAAELSINPDYLRQLFVKWVGEPPVRYLIGKRLEAACDLLRLNQESTAAIAERVGIANPFYFSRLFRQRFGITPTQYREQYAASRD